MKKRLTEILPALLLACLLAFLSCAAAEDVYWICPNCGRGGNDRNFCPDCGSPRPVAPEGFNDSLTQIPGETDRVSVDILRVDGSSYVKAKKDPYQYAEWNVTDEKPETCWQFAAKNVKKKPAWLSLVVEGQTVDEVWILNGNRSADKKGNSLYADYARPKDVQVVFVYETEGAEALTLDFTLPEGESEGWEKLDTGRQEHVYAVDVNVLSVWPGKKNKTNACLAELLLVQRNDPENAKPAME